MYGRKLDILDHFTIMVKNMEFELGSSCEHTESMFGLIQEVRTRMPNLLWVSVMF